jgi:cytochrome P450
MSNDSMPDLDFHGEALDNIFEDYKERLSKCPVGHSDKYGGFTYITKFDDIFAAEQDPSTYSVAPSMLLPSFGTDRPMIPIDIDPPEHTAYRKLLLPLMTPAAVEKLTPGMHQTSRDLARELAESLRENGTADASTLYARPMPTIIFSRLAGFPEADWPLFDAWVDDIIYERTQDPERARQAGVAVNEYFASLLAARKGSEPTEDLMSVLEHAQIDGRPLSQDELLSYCYLLFLGGLDTTAWAIRASLWYLARNPEAQQQLRDDPELIPAAAEEFLRTLSPVQSMARTCLKDTVVRGVEIKAGERVVLSFGAGNRDPEIFEHPNEIRFDRDRNRHLAFGGGIHRCLGSNLGRRELVVALEEFLANVPKFEAADLDEVWHGVGTFTIKSTS